MKKNASTCFSKQRTLNLDLLNFQFVFLMWNFRRDKTSEYDYELPTAPFEE